MLGLEQRRHRLGLNALVEGQFDARCGAQVEAAGEGLQVGEQAGCHCGDGAAVHAAAEMAADGLVTAQAGDDRGVGVTEDDVALALVALGLRLALAGELRFDDGTRVTLEAGCSLSIEKPDEGGRLQLRSWWSRQAMRQRQNPLKDYSLYSSFERVQSRTLEEGTEKSVRMFQDLRLPFGNATASLPGKKFSLNLKIDRQRPVQTSLYAPETP